MSGATLNNVANKLEEDRQKHRIRHDVEAIVPANDALREDHPAVHKLRQDAQQPLHDSNLGGSLVPDIDEKDNGITPVEVSGNTERLNDQTGHTETVLIYFGITPEDTLKSLIHHHH